VLLPAAVLDALPGLTQTQHMSFCMLLESPSAIQLGQTLSQMLAVAWWGSKVLCVRTRHKRGPAG